MRVIVFQRRFIKHIQVVILIQQTKNVQEARQVDSQMLSEIIKNEKNLKACIYEAIEVEKAGLKVVKKKTSDYAIPEEFQNKLDEIPHLKIAFEAFDAWTTKRILVLFFSTKTIQNKGIQG